MATSPLATTYGKDVPYAVTQNLQRLQHSLDGLTAQVQTAREAAAAQAAAVAALRREVGSLTARVGSLAKQVADLQAALP